MAQGFIRGTNDVTDVLLEVWVMSYPNKRFFCAYTDTGSCVTFAMDRKIDQQTDRSAKRAQISQIYKCLVLYFD